MDASHKQAAAVMVRCKGYSRKMAEGFLKTLLPSELASLAALDPLKDPECGSKLKNLLDEIADRKMQDERADEETVAELAEDAGDEGEIDTDLE